MASGEAACDVALLLCLWSGDVTVTSSPFAAQLGCTFEEAGCVAVGKYQVTNVPHLFVAGDASGSIQLAIVAASEGTQAAIAINKALLTEDN